MSRAVPKVFFSTLPSASTIGLPLLSSAMGTGISQFFAPAGIVDAGAEWFTGDFLPNLPPPVPELVPDDPQLVRDLLQPLPDRVDRPP